ncbi:two-partner secretion domain-containing protein [Nostoc sp. 'Lobaria pulmonaria (5183) cyanobiont']|uniref:two-partner secretion domain-containing protein n=1 Tax=Nostoc sp. 'Lobaria pulmonaria (5183) cyanobiont' TaxID=1618022 RepID=UPI000CF328B7|nr:filamentous hemagglutinin N-terminal domain-containing protein [Nostoc sp. 'Lobaria pulmonaria (5183) cyanobiont']AVH72416.1 filamentous hemagglutinin family outer membrane protein [Nostoc sp. 'Lobaria pulmonaria (5183) cyanobiont']
MSQNRSSCQWKLGMVSTLVIAGVLTFAESFALAQIKTDATLGSESSIITPKLIDGQPTDQIDGGAVRGTNLFHSFEQFSVSAGRTAHFNNAIDIQNIISRVTGNSVSNIDGILKANGTANVFLINPNGIVFGRNASLNIGGSFVASTASSLNFADGTKFSATSGQTAPLLKESVPIGLQFGTTARPIRNQSQASPNNAINSFAQNVGLQVRQGKTLALIGGDLTLEGGNLTASGGRIELGSVAGNSLVGLSSTNQGWALGYEGVQNFQNIELTQQSEIPSTVDTSGKGGGNIHLQGQRVLVTDGSQISALTLGAQPGGNLTVNASESVELGINAFLSTGTFDTGNSGDINITTRKLIVKDGAQVIMFNAGSGLAGQLTINASDSVELIAGIPIAPLPDGSDLISSGLFNATYGTQNAGNIIINTGKLRIEGGAAISTSSEGILGHFSNQFIPATGNGGDLIVNAFESVELIGTSANGSRLSSLFAGTQGSGNGGNLTLTTGRLVIKDGAAITVSSEARKNVNYQGGVPNLGLAGELNVSARSILLDKGKLTSDSESGKGGDIAVQVQDLLLMRRNSQISTNAGGDKTGGNITINAPNGFLVATPFGNSDITANANFGSGGKIAIAAKNTFGFVSRPRAEVERLDPKDINPNNLPTSDITAFSQQNPSLSGTVQINSPDADPSKGLVELPVNLVDASQQVTASCSSGGKIGRSSFVTTGRGGIQADPTEPLIADDAVLADWIALPPESQNRAEGIQKRAVVKAQVYTEEKSQKVNSVNEPTQIVEAQGWILDADGNVVLVAQVPTGSPHNSSLVATSCAAN